MAEADNYTRLEGANRIHRSRGDIELTVNLALVEDVRAGNIEDGLLPQSRESEKWKHQ